MSPTLCAPAAATETNVSGVDTSTGVAVTFSALGFLPSAPRPLHPNAKSLPSLANASVCWLPTATSSTTTSVKILTGLIVASKFPVPVCPHVFAPHAYAAPSSVIITAWLSPAAIFFTVPASARRDSNQSSPKRTNEPPSESTKRTYPLNPIQTRPSLRYRTRRFPSPIVARVLRQSRLVAPSRESRVPFLVRSPRARYPPTSAPS